MIDIENIDYDNIKDVKTLIQKLESAFDESLKLEKEYSKFGNYETAIEETIFQKNTKWFIGLLKQMERID